MRIANNPQKLLKTPFPSRLNDRGDVEVQTIVNNFRVMNHERFGESMDLGLIADIYDVISGHSTDKFLVWCHRLMKPLENGCVWALVKGEEIHKVDEKFNETGTIVSDGLRRRRSDHASRNIDAINMTMQSAAKSSSFYLLLLSCISSCGSIGTCERCIAIIGTCIYDSAFAFELLYSGDRSLEIALIGQLHSNPRLL
uniref:Cytochrome P450 n=1 Tax=Ascaris lumbricoides TaxID=6252 RepID=A0A0M3HF72_ASCLU